jgi:HK97 gp10 family phage protein
MADGVVFELKGVREAAAALNALSADMRRKVVYAALRDAGKPVAASAKARAPVLKKATARRVPGTMRRAIGVFRSKRYKAANGQIGVYISVRASRAQRKRSPVSGDPFYFRFVEAGHGKRQPQRGGLSRALRRAAAERVKPYPFLGPAFRAEGGNALRIFEQRIVERVARANAAK